jgi:hypothetical protein
MNLSLLKDYWPTLKTSLFLQIGIGFLAAIVTSSDEWLPFWWRAVAAYWGCFIVMVFRRPKTPTKLDLFLAEWGFVILLPCTLIISVYIWRWMGVIFYRRFFHY